MSKTQRCALYARVSTVDKGQDPELQLSPLRKYCEARGWTITGEYVDVGVSGARDKRPELNRLMDLVRKRKVDVIAVWKLDRWGRSMKHLVTSLADLETFVDRIRHMVDHELDGADSIVIRGNDEVNRIRIAIGVHHGDDRYIDNVTLFDGNRFPAHIDDEE